MAQLAVLLPSPESADRDGGECRSDSDECKDRVPYQCVSVSILRGGAGRERSLIQHHGGEDGENSHNELNQEHDRSKVPVALAPARIAPRGQGGGVDIRPAELLGLFSSGHHAGIRDEEPVALLGGVGEERAENADAEEQGNERKLPGGDEQQEDQNPTVRKTEAKMVMPTRARRPCLTRLAMS